MNSSASWVGPGMLFQTPEPEAEDLMVSRQRSCDSILHSPRHRDREIDRSATRMYSSPCLTTQSVVDVQTLQDALESKISWKQAVDRAMRPVAPLPCETSRPPGVDRLLLSGLCHAREAAGARSPPLSSRSSPQLSARGPCRDMHAHAPPLRQSAAAPSAAVRTVQGVPAVAVVAASPHRLAQHPLGGEQVIVVGSTGARSARGQMPQPVATAPGGFPFAHPGHAGPRAHYTVVYPSSPPVPA
ncbi:unnamed protein product [Prorocentrum cordatum]|uniref:Uncharacterized protein n=1 Tax=Prorocentrum cordatum TaxID=2364126 RepID=A0ABN9VQZ1_9DINO|nr:unnamed protein product [Polarella glacialis]